MKHLKIKELVYTSLLCAMLFVITTYISIPTSFGFLNLSDAVIHLLSSSIPLKPLLFIASVATSLADLIGGYGQYAVFTFIIKFLMALTVFVLYRKLKIHYLFSIILAEIVMLLGYGLTDVVLSSSWIVFIESIIANLPQAIVCVVVAYIIHPFFKKVKLYGTK